MRADTSKIQVKKGHKFWEVYLPNVLAARLFADFESALDFVRRELHRRRNVEA